MVKYSTVRESVVKSDLERRLSRLNLDILDSNYRRLSLNTRIRDPKPLESNDSSNSALKRMPSEQAVSSTTSSDSAKTAFSDEKEAYKTNVMLIIGAAKRCRVAYKEDEHYLIQAAANVITSTIMFNHK